MSDILTILPRKIEDIDPNFKICAEIHKEDPLFYHVDDPPFQVCGITKENGKYHRIPDKIAQSVSKDVHDIHTQTAGGRVRFRTNSPTITIIAKMGEINKMPHFAITGSAGFDLYKNNCYTGTFTPPFSVTDGYESTVDLGTGEWRDITINFPLYSEVLDLHVGLKKGSSLCEPAPFAIKNPRPGNTYQSMISRRIDCDYINLGFSGSAKAEDEMAAYIKTLDMSVFVYDYDHNAPSAEHLRQTHEKMFKVIRNANPQLPIIMMSRPTCHPSEDELNRLEIIKSTYRNAVSQGDKNVYFLDGRRLMAQAGPDGTVDGCHPNDLGFASMAAALGDLIEKILIR